MLINKTKQEITDRFNTGNKNTVMFLLGFLYFYFECAGEISYPEIWHSIMAKCGLSREQYYNDKDLRKRDRLVIEANHKLTLEIIEKEISIYLLQRS